MTIDDHYDQAYQQMKLIKIKRIESEQIVKRECSRMMEQIEGIQQQQSSSPPLSRSQSSLSSPLAQQLTDFLQSDIISKRDHLRSEYKRQLEIVLNELEKKGHPFQHAEQAKNTLLMAEAHLQSLTVKANEWKKISELLW